MTTRRARLALLGLLVLAPVLWAALHHVRERERSEDLLEAVATAHRRTGYEGKASGRGSRRPPMRVVHDAESGRTRYGWGQWGHVEPAPSGRMPDPAAFCLDLPSLLVNYRAREGEAGRFLGRAVGTLHVEPRHEGRPSLEILFDRETLLPLRVTTSRHDGSAYLEVAFDSFSAGERRVEPGAWDGMPPFVRLVAPERADAAAGFALWAPEYLPEGFRALECRVSDWAGPHAVVHYTDGVTAFDLWQRPVLSPAQVETYLVRRGGHERAAREMRWVLRRARRALVRSGAAGPDGIAAECEEGRRHRHYEMCVGDREVTLVSRSDLDPEESLRVLRSLRAR